MKVFVNGSSREFDSLMTIDKLLDHLKINKKNCLVELNQVVLAPKNLKQKLKEGDRLELVRFIGGG